jgi:hypothetical protein
VRGRYFRRRRGRKNVAAIRGMAEKASDSVLNDDRTLAAEWRGGY